MAVAAGAIGAGRTSMLMRISLPLDSSQCIFHVAIPCHGRERPVLPDEQPLACQGQSRRKPRGYNNKLRFPRDRRLLLSPLDPWEVGTVE